MWCEVSLFGQMCHILNLRLEPWREILNTTIGTSNRRSLLCTGGQTPYTNYGALARELSHCHEPSIWPT